MSSVKFYCESCSDDRTVCRPIKIERLSTDKLNRPKIWGDILCAECGFVIATITADEPGLYDFLKVEE